MRVCENSILSVKRLVGNLTVGKVDPVPAATTKKVLDPNNQFTLTLQKDMASQVLEPYLPGALPSGFQT